MPVFLGVDGEAVKDRYLLFGAGEQALLDRDGLDLVRVLDWLANFPKGLTMVAFSFHYDVGMMVRGYRDSLILRMMKSEPVAFGRWRVRYFPRHILKAVTHGARVEIFDVWGFFQSSFEAAIENQGLRVPQVIRWGKRNRGRFSLRELAEITRYNAAECQKLAELCDGLDLAMRSQGITVKSWHGPGAIADSVLRRCGVQEEMRRPNLGLKDLFARAYFGGRIETMKIGTVEVDVYDVNSAYPEACTWLWDQTKGNWEQTYHWTDRQFPVSVWHLSWLLPNRTYVGPLPFRRPDGRIYFPRMGRGWYWWPEADLAVRLHPEVKVLEGYVWTGRSSTSLARTVQDLYSRRLALKAAGSAVEAHVLKLAMNSLYGKMAQTVGRAPWQAPAWAGYVTAYARAKLREAVIGYEEDVVAFATDGVFMRRGSSLPVGIGEGLGQWKLSHGFSGLVLGSGLYRLSGMDGAVKEGTRGGKLPWGKVLRDLNRQGYADVKDTVFVSPLLAILMPEAYGPYRGKWMQRRRIIAPWADPRTKRHYQYLAIRDWSKQWCDSSMVDGWFEESAPFDGDWLAGMPLTAQEHLLDLEENV